MEMDEIAFFLFTKGKKTSAKKNKYNIFNIYYIW